MKKVLIQMCFVVKEVLITNPSYSCKCLKIKGIWAWNNESINQEVFCDNKGLDD